MLEFVLQMLGIVLVSFLISLAIILILSVCVVYLYKNRETISKILYDSNEEEYYEIEIEEDK